MFQIQIQSSPAKLDIYPAHAKLQLQTEPQKIEQTQPAAILEITGNKSGTLEIDTVDARYAMGYKNNTALRQDMASAGQQATSDFIDRMVDEGNRMMQIEKGFQAIYDMSWEAVNPDIPAAPVIKYKPGANISYNKNQDFKINWRTNKATLNVQASKVANNTQAAKVTTNVASYGSLKIDWTGQASPGVDVKA